MPLYHSLHQKNSRFAQICLFAATTAALPINAIAANDAESEKKTQSLEEFGEAGSDKFNWRVVDDGVMGGLSKGRLSMSRDGAAKFEGVLSLENNGGFSSIRTARMSPLDLSQAEGLVIRVKGDGRTYQLRLESDARFRGQWAVSFSADVATKKNEWVEVQVPFSSFKGGWRGRDLGEMTLNPGKIERVGIILADKIPGPFKLEVDWIRTFGGSVGG